MFHFFEARRLWLNVKQSVTALKHFYFISWNFIYSAFDFTYSWYEKNKYCNDKVIGTHPGWCLMSEGKNTNNSAIVAVNANHF